MKSTLPEGTANPVAGPLSPGGRVFRDGFRKFSTLTAGAVGSPITFLLALATIVIWAALGPVKHFSDTWQLVINTGTTIVTFLMVFLIQNTQNRDARAIHLKLDELIRGSKGARNQLVDLENCDEDEINELEKEFQRLRLERTSSGEIHAKMKEMQHATVSKK